MRILVIIPTYNEAENIQLIIEDIFKTIWDISVLVIDDNSTDNTQQKVEEIMNSNKKIYLLRRNAKLGLASAYIDGFKWGIANNFNVFCEMDADFSHNPKYLTEMIENINKYDVVIGSRNINGGKVKNWSILRNIISKCGSFYSRFVLGFPPVYDLTGGYNMWTLSALEKINIDSIISEGYLFQIEMKYKAYKNHCKILEIPITFENRKYGKSKMSLNIFLEAFVKIWNIRKNFNNK